MRETINVNFELDRNPEFLYRYRPFNKYSLSEILNDNVWFASADTLNDPFEMSIKNDLKALGIKVSKIGGASGFEDITDKIDGEVIKRVHEMRDALLDGLNEILENTGVLCFSTKPDQSLMWSHYADSHRGICLEYERDLGNPVWRYTKPVNYIENRLPVLQKFTEILQKQKGTMTNQDFYDLADLIIYAKHNIWAYEDEWRLIDPSGGAQLLKIPAKIKSIIYGKNMPKEDRMTLLKMFPKGGDVNLKRCVTHTSPEFNLKIIEANDWIEGS